MTIPCNTCPSTASCVEYGSCQLDDAPTLLRAPTDVIEKALLVLAPRHMTRDYRPEDAAADEIRVAVRELLAQRDEAFAALRGCIQYGIDEDGRAWIAANPGGVDAVASLLEITADSIRKELGAAPYKRSQ